MIVNRIVANIATEDPERARQFYGEILGLKRVMDHGWIVTYAAEGNSAPQVSFARQGGAGAPVPDISVEVDDLDMVHKRVLAAGIAVEYGPAEEDWGVRRFFVRDPFGKLVNILAHRR
ncbi:VOC family protein [Bosea rubneri]|uniref:VOC family protein n=1 Tax=Bosea rubneri TaxID=3075434 RepID=A0ABU3SCR4_9HYPH|nr:VOC family protein [Bosea sp. ZW T0_25]MDU0342588.1 VOC family protein [Bosea sp. ZW T0_25]